MNTERQVLLRDFLLGLGAAVAPGYFFLDRIDPWTVVPLVAGAALFAWAEYRAERDAFPGWVTDLADRPALVVGIGVAVAALGLLPLAVWPGAVGWYLGLFAGAGLGLVANRVAFGLVWPIPEEYLHRLEERQV